MQFAAGQVKIEAPTKPFMPENKLMIKIWGRATSSNVQLTMWGAAELGLKVERIDAGGIFGKTDQAEFRAMNPNGLVPVLQDGDLNLFESAAILRYLAAQYGNEGFWPADPATRAKLDAWAEWTKTSLCPVLIYQVFWTLVRTPKAERDMTQFAAQVETLGELMTLAEQRIGENEYLGGTELSFADVMFGHTLYRYFTLEFERRDLPNVKRYYDQLCTRAAYRDHVMVDYSSLQVE